MSKVLFISYDGMTDPLGQSQVIPYLDGLRKEGYDVSILSFEKPEKFLQLGGQIGERLAAAGIIWHPLTFHSKPPLLSKWWDIRLMKSKADELYKKEKYDLIHCRSYIAADVGLELKRKYGVKLLFDMRGFWADEKAEGGNWDKEHFFWKRVYGYYKKKEKELLRESDHIVSLTNAAKREMETWSFYNKDIPISVIPCCADTKLFTVNDAGLQKASKEKLGIPEDSFVLSYLGSVGTWYMLDEMLSFFRVLRKKVPGALFLFITNSKPEVIKEKLAGQDVPAEAVKIINVNYRDVPAAMMASDLSISFIKPVFSKTASSPTKIGETMCMGIEVVSNDIGDCGSIIEACNAGHVVREFSEKEYSRIIDSVLEQRKDPVAIRANAVSYYGLDEGIRKYNDVYSSILAN